MRGSLNDKLLELIIVLLDALTERIEHLEEHSLKSVEISGR